MQDKGTGPPRAAEAPEDRSRRTFVRILTAGTIYGALGGTFGCGDEGQGPRDGGLVADAGDDRDGGRGADAGNGTPDAGEAPDGGEGGFQGRGRVALVRTSDRALGVRAAVELLGLPLPGGRVAVKPNLNSSAATPGSTHPSVLRALIELLQENGAEVTVAERSGSEDTRAVVEQLGFDVMADELGVELVVLDELEADGWERVHPVGSHWRNGFPMARVFLEADAVVQTCCLKTHAFGGHFTLSLKNSVGMVARVVPGEGYDYMSELHDSTHIRRMIAEINAAYAPALIVLDGVEAFVTGGPDLGRLVAPGVMLAATDRVALDAVGVALLRLHGTTPEVEAGAVFAQAQLARAVELGLGAAGPDEVVIVTADREAAQLAEELMRILRGG